LFQRESFWDALMKVIGGGTSVYAGYSYRERADRYLREFTHDELAQLRAASGLVRYTILSDQIRSGAFTQAELYVKREA
jgi:hypothetical protein